MSIAENECIEAVRGARFLFYNRLDVFQEQNVHELSTSEKYTKRLENNRKSAEGAKVHEVVQRAFQITKLNNLSRKEYFAEAELLVYLQMKLKTLLATRKSIEEEIEEQKVSNIELLENDRDSEPM